MRPSYGVLRHKSVLHEPPAYVRDSFARRITVSTEVVEQSRMEVTLPSSHSEVPLFPPPPTVRQAVEKSRDGETHDMGSLRDITVRDATSLQA